MATVCLLAKCSDMFPLTSSITPISDPVHDLPLLLLLLLLLLSWGARGHAA